MKSGTIKKIPHITISISGLKKAVTFYEDVLGLEKLGEWPSYALFDIGGVTFGVEPKAKPHICLLVDDVDKAFQQLKERGAKFVTEPKDQPWVFETRLLLTPTGTR